MPLGTSFAGIGPAAAITIGPAGGGKAVAAGTGLGGAAIPSLDEGHLNIPFKIVTHIYNATFFLV